MCAPAYVRQPSVATEVLSLEEGPQKLPHLIVGPHHVEVEHAIVDQRENQPDALAETTLVNVMAAALGRQVTNANSRMLMRTAEVLLNGSNGFADLLTCVLR